MLNLLVLLVACSPDPQDSGDSGDTAGIDTADTADTAPGPDPFADAVVDFSPGETAGFGQDALPDIVLGPPEGAGDAGSTHVLSLGQDGSIVLALTDIELIDGPGPDLLVFENPFTDWYETGAVAVSEDGSTWHEWPCNPTDETNLFPGCAGVGLVYASTASGIDPTDPAVAGGDAFDLSELGLSTARYVRIVDTGTNRYSGNSGGFDLDAIAVVNGQEITR